MSIGCRAPASEESISNQSDSYNSFYESGPPRDTRRMSSIAIRGAAPADADAIAVIYNQGIEDRLATLETETRSAEERRGWRGCGVGRRLLEALIARGRELGYHKLVLAAFPFNVAGVALYRRLGFAEVGVYREQGQLDGKWVDVVVMEKLL